VATNLKFKRPIDDKKSTRWAVSSLSSEGISLFGAGGGVGLFHLVNRETHRGHRFEVWTLGLSVSPPVSASVAQSDYVNFVTPSPMNFLDFDGAHITIREIDAGLYGYTTLKFLGMAVEIAGGGLNVPGFGVSHGKINIMFGDGRPMGVVDLILKLRPDELPPGPARVTQKETPVVYQLGSDILFAFNRWTLTPGIKTEDALKYAGMYVTSAATPNTRFLVTGHTDNIGSGAYNTTLSKKRAETVVKWLVTHNYPHPVSMTAGLPGNWFKTVGKGFTDPIESNLTKEGRAKNRRVEIHALPLKAWQSY